MSASLGRLLGPAVVLGASVGWSQAAHAQNFRFTLRAEPDVIPANGISTTSILVQVPQDRSAISANPIVRFATTAGVIESQAQLSGGVARVLLRSSPTPGTAVVTAFIGSSREAVTVEFSEDNGMSERYLEVAAPYVAYGSDQSIVTASGKTALDFGDLHIQSDVRLDVDLSKERVWAQGNKGGVSIRYGSGAKARELRGDRLFYDLRRRQGVIRRADGDASGTQTGARQEFVGTKFEAPPAPSSENEPGAPLKPEPQTPALAPSPNVDLQGNKEAGSRFVVPVAPPTAPLQARDGVEVAPDAPAPTFPATPDATSPEAAASASATGAASATGTGNAVGAPESEAPPAPTSASITPAVEPPNGDVSAPGSVAPITPAVDGVESAKEGETAPGTAPDEANRKPEANSNIEVASNAEATEGESEKTGDSAKDEPVKGDDAAPSTVVPGSLAAAPEAPNGQETRVRSLVTKPRLGNGSNVGGGAEAPPPLTPYVPLPENKDFQPRIVELPPPNFDTASGYWVASRRLRVFPRDKVQFERASIYFNGGKAFSMPTYVLPLDGSFDPTTDMFAFNSQGGLSVKVPFYYQATKHGTGSLTLRREPGAGFGTQQSGFSLALDHQYWLSSKANGKLNIDQIGNGPFNVNFQHLQQLGARTNAAMYINMPQHRDFYARTSLTHDFSSMQIGLESFFDRPQDSKENVRAQFYARMRPRNVGKSGWTYTSGLNFLGVQNLAYTERVSTGIGGGPHGGGGTKIVTRYRPLMGQTLNLSLQSPSYSPWRGAQFSMSLTGSAFNYSQGNRGIAPGVQMGLSQHLGKADLRLDYNYDRSSLGLYGATGDSYTHYISGSLGIQLAKNIGFSSFLSKSLQDDSMYGSADVSYYFLPRWRAALFTDYTRLSLIDSTLNYGISIGRSIGGREITLNWDAIRGKFYFEIGQGRF